MNFQSMLFKTDAFLAGSINAPRIFQTERLTANLF